LANLPQRDDLKMVPWKIDVNELIFDMKALVLSIETLRRSSIRD